MKIQAIAKQLVVLCRKADWETAQRKLYAKNAISREAEAAPGKERETKGRAAIIKKGKGFTAMIEKMHDLAVSDPIVADNSFACTMMIDVTMKGQGRMKLTEVCVYEVKRGKIVSEQFFM